MATLGMDALLGPLSRMGARQYMSVVFVSRIMLLVALWAMTGGHELSNDTSMHMDMIRHPLSVLLYTQHEYQQNPPLLPFLETAIGYPLQLFLSDFLTLRLVMIVYEVILSGLFYLLLIRLKVGEARRALALGAYLLLPMGWMTSVVMAQDEVIAAAAFLLPLLFFISRREGAAILLCGIGVVAAKLFIGLELLTLIALAGRRRWIPHALIGFAPIVLVYGAMSVHRFWHGLPLPLLGFRPDPSYGTNFWMLLQTYGGISLRQAGPYSGVLALSVSLIPAAIVFSRSQGAGTVSTATTVAIAVNTSLLLFLSLFYHVNPEYFIMITPILLATARDMTDAVSCLLISVIPWAGKFFQNAEFMAHASVNSGKLLALKYYMMIFHSPPESWLAACQIAFSLLTIFLSIRGCLRLANPLLRQTSPIGATGSRN